MRSWLHLALPEGASSHVAELGVDGGWCCREGSEFELSFAGNKEDSNHLGCDSSGHKGVFYYVNEIAFGKPLAYLGMGNGPQRSQPSDDKVGTFSPTPDLHGGERGWRLCLVTNCQ